MQRIQKNDAVAAIYEFCCKISHPISQCIELIFSENHQQQFMANIKTMKIKLRTCEIMTSFEGQKVRLSDVDFSAAHHR